MLTRLDPSQIEGQLQGIAPLLGAILLHEEAKNNQ